MHVPFGLHYYNEIEV